MEKSSGTGFTSPCPLYMHVYKCHKNCVCPQYIKKDTTGTARDTIQVFWSLTQLLTVHQNDGGGGGGGGGN